MGAILQVFGQPPFFSSRNLLKSTLRSRDVVIPMENPNNPTEITSDEELEDAARKIVELFRSPLRALAPGQDPKVIIGLMSRAIEDPEGLVREMVVEARKTNPDQQREDLRAIFETVRSPRKLLDQLVKDVLPKGVRGKKPKITEIKEKQMISLAQALFPAARFLIDLRQASPKRSVAESVDYLEKDYPLPTARFRKWIRTVEEFFRRVDRLPKPISTQARRLVYEIIAREFEISVDYAERWIGPSLPKKKATN